FASCTKGISILAVYGGTPIDGQLRALKRGVHVIVGTPGRMLDIMRRKRVDLSGIERVILDEADEMLNMGFQEDLEAILAGVPDSAHTLLFSATMPRQVAAIAKNYMDHPEEITVGQRNAGAENVSHECYVVHQRDRYLALKRICDYYPDMYAIVFCRTRQDTQGIADWLIRDGYSADAIHGDLSQAQRDRVMQKFRTRSIQMLVATDVAARGLDVNDLTHVINFNLPDDLNSYTHRSGRTGRAGKSGVSVVIVNMRERGKVKRIQKMIGTTFNFRNVPSGYQICEAQLFSLVDRMRNVEIDHRQIDPYLPAINATLEGMTNEEIVKRFMALEISNLLNYYSDEHHRGPGTQTERPAEPAKAPKTPTPRKQAEQTEHSVQTERPAPPQSPRDARMFINLGRLDGINPKKLGDLINRECGRKVPIRKVDIMRRYSFFEIAPEDAEPIMHMLSKARVGGRDVRVEPVDDQLKSKRTKRTERRVKAKAGKPGKRKPSKGKPGKAKTRKNSRKPR
ncbi:MAG: DEAD/DEAH box helicase, partial [Kiritimatiellia bacterium]|nr:DEAD/DEAH box helicase [Kiritimatiellia bacterium]